MDYQDLVSHVEELGLSNKEARVYLASLTLGPSSVQHLADQSGIKRVTTYVILESLIGLGLISQSVKGKKTLFLAEDPSVLNRLIERRSAELAEQRMNLKQILPRLSSLGSGPKDIPEVRFYEGSASVRSMLADFFLNYHGGERELVGFGNADEMADFYPEIDRIHLQTETLRRSFTARIIYTSARGRILDEQTVSRAKLRYVKPELFPGEAMIGILGDNVLIVSFVDARPMVITIRNTSTARSLKSIFELAWSGAEPSGA